MTRLETLARIVGRKLSCIARDGAHRWRVAVSDRSRGDMHLIRSLRVVALSVLFAYLVIGCDKPNTIVVLDNDYPPSTTNGRIVYHAFWQAVSFTTPVPPDSSSDPQTTVPASANTAYVILAPGWDPTADGAASTPTSFIVLQSRNGFAVHINSTLHIPVDDSTFVGDCAAGSLLTQDQADFITQRVFASDFAGLSYDAGTCTTTGGP
jgi:hypothetical protein